MRSGFVTWSPVPRAVAWIVCRRRCSSSEARDGARLARETQLARADAQRAHLLGDVEDQLSGPLPGQARIGDRQAAAVEGRARRLLKALVAALQEALQQEAAH